MKTEQEYLDTEIKKDDVLMVPLTAENISSGWHQIKSYLKSSYMGITKPTVSEWNSILLNLLSGRLELFIIYKVQGDKNKFCGLLSGNSIVGTTGAKTFLLSHLVIEQDLELMTYIKLYKKLLLFAKGRNCKYIKCESDSKFVKEMLTKLVTDDKLTICTMYNWEV